MFGKNKKSYDVLLERYHARFELIGQLERENKINNTFIGCIKNAIKDGGVIFEIIDTDKEQMVISICEKHSRNGQICRLSMKLYSTGYSTHLILAELNCDFVYDEDWGFLSYAFIYHFTCKEHNKGYGSIVIENFLRYAKKIKVPKVTGWLSPFDLNRSSGSTEMLHHFYKKHGFMINGDHIELQLYHKTNTLTAE